MIKRLTTIAAATAVGAALSVIGATAAHAATLQGLYPSAASCAAAGAAGRPLWGPEWWCSPIQVGNITDYGLYIFPEG